MLFNPDWNKSHDVKADVFTLDTLIAWLEHQPPKSHYDYRNCHNCLLAQYFYGQDWQDVEVSKNFVQSIKHGWLGMGTKVTQQHMLPPFFNWIAEESPHSYGAALSRARLARDEPKEAIGRSFSWR